MKLLYVAIFHNQGEEVPILLASAANLSSFSLIGRGSIKEYLRAASRLVIQRTPTAARQTVPVKDYNANLHCVVRADSLACVAVTDEEYPRTSAFKFLSDMLTSFEKAEGKWQAATKDSNVEPEYLVKGLTTYADPKNFDKLVKVQKSLEEVKDLMQQNIDAILKQGETLDSLVQKSQDLSDHSKKFHKNAKKLKPCCSL